VISYFWAPCFTVACNPDALVQALKVSMEVTV